jgi:hypothetical protein
MISNVTPKDANILQLWIEMCAHFWGTGADKVNFQGYQNTTSRFQRSHATEPSSM